VTQVPVVDLMSHPTICVTPEATLAEALSAMLRSGIRHIVVVEPDGTCLGILTDRAVTAAWAADPSALSWQTAGALLDPLPAVVSATATVSDAARMMFRDRVDAVAVVDDAGRAVGVLTVTDLVVLMATHAEPAVTDQVPRREPAPGS